MIVKQSILFLIITALVLYAIGKDHKDDDFGGFSF